MVGVPGKSKGCATCRRRKIRCDLQQPACMRCTRSGRECEGYARFNVFINRNLQGPEKRHGLEEVRPTLGARTGFPLMAQQAALRDPSMPSSVSYIRESLPSGTPSDDRILLAPDASIVLDKQLIALFWDKYMPIDYAAQGDSPCFWMEQIVAQSSVGVALDLSLKALAMTRLGWVNRDSSMVLQGNMVYGRALHSVQNSLRRANMAMHDDILVAGYVLTVYELFESTTTSVSGWNSHVSGLAQLILARGPQKHQSPITRATLEEFRAAAVIQCIQYRKSSFLGTEDWKRIPWQVTPKDVYQKLYDKGFDIAALLEKIDSGNLLKPTASLSALSGFLRDLSGLNTEMEQWYQELLSECPSPLYWPTSPRSGATPTGTDNGPCEALASETMAPFVFPSLRIASITATYWGLRIILSNTIAITCGAILSANMPSRRAGSLSFSNLETMAQQLLSEHGDRVRLEHATNIMRTMPYSLNDRMGLLGAQRSLFGLRTALFSLRRHPGEELKWCKAVCQQIDEKKGLRYAHEIAKLDSGLNTSLTVSLPVRTGEASVSHPGSQGQVQTPSGHSSNTTTRSPANNGSQPPDVDEAFITDAYRHDAITRIAPASPTLTHPPA